MIDVVELERLRKSFLLLSQAIDFPDREVLYLANEAERVVPDLPEKAALLAILNEFAATPLQELQEDYTRIFELNKRITLYATYYKLEDSRERGGVLAKLKMLYEMFGVELDLSEMTDYLPTMLEFLAVGKWSNGPVIDARIEDLQLLFSVLEDGTYEILAHAKELENEPYIRLVRLIRVILRYCVKHEGGDRDE